MESNSNEQKATSGAGSPLERTTSERYATSGTGVPVHKEIPTIAKSAIYTGDYQTVAAQAKTRVPDDTESVIERNTVAKLCGSNGCCCRR